MVSSFAVPAIILVCACRERAPNDDPAARQPLRHHLWRIGRWQDRKQQAHHGVHCLCELQGRWRDQGTFLPLFATCIVLIHLVLAGQGANSRVEPAARGVWQRENAPKRQLVALWKVL